MHLWKGNCRYRGTNNQHRSHRQRAPIIGLRTLTRLSISSLATIKNCTILLMPEVETLIIDRETMYRISMLSPLLTSSPKDVITHNQNWSISDRRTVASISGAKWFIDLSRINLDGHRAAHGKLDLMMSQTWRKRSRPEPIWIKTANSRDSLTRTMKTWAKTTCLIKAYPGHRVSRAVIWRSWIREVQRGWETPEFKAITNKEKNSLSKSRRKRMRPKLTRTLTWTRPKWNCRRVLTSKTQFSKLSTVPRW